MPLRWTARQRLSKKQDFVLVESHAGKHFGREVGSVAMP